MDKVNSRGFNMHKSFDEWKHLNDTTADLYKIYDASPIFYDWEEERNKLAAEEEDFLKGLIKYMKNAQPYPERIFTTVGDQEWEKVHRVLRENGIQSARVFGDWGRRVWDNAITEIKGTLAKDHKLIISNLGLPGMTLLFSEKKLIVN